jgi:hypothetical protein
MKRKLQVLAAVACALWVSAASAAPSVVEVRLSEKEPARVAAMGEVQAGGVLRLRPTRPGRLEVRVGEELLMDCYIGWYEDDRLPLVPVEGGPEALPRVVGEEREGQPWGAQKVGVYGQTEFEDILGSAAIPHGELIEGRHQANQGVGDDRDSQATACSVQPARETAWKEDGRNAMSWWRRWVVLVPGKVTWVERRAREFLEEHGDGREHPFVVIPGQEHYQAIVEKERGGIGPELLLGELFSLECKAPVYTIEGIEEFPCVSCFMKGERTRSEQEPEELVRSLGCESEWTVEPPLRPVTKPTRTAGLVQGLSTPRILDALAASALAKGGAQPFPPAYCHLEETSLGLLLKEGAGWLGSALIDLAFRFPRATIYSITATPNLDFFNIFVMHKKKTLEFAPSPEEATYYPAVHEIMGEREPERILAALGIPKEWFQL